MKKIRFRDDVLGKNSFPSVDIRDGNDLKKGFVLLAGVVIKHDIEIGDYFDYEQTCYQVTGIKEDMPHVLLICQPVDENRLETSNLQSPENNKN